MWFCSQRGPPPSPHPPRQSGGEAGAQHGRSPAPQHQQQLVNGVAAVAALGMAAAAAEGDDAGDQAQRKQHAAPEPSAARGGVFDLANLES